MLRAPNFYQILTEHEISRYIFTEVSNIKERVIPSGRNRVGICGSTDGQTDAETDGWTNNLTKFG